MSPMMEVNSTHFRAIEPQKRLTSGLVPVKHLLKCNDGEGLMRRVSTLDRRR